MVGMGRKKKKILKSQIIAEKAYHMVENCPSHKIGELTVTEIARRLEVHISYLSRVFREYHVIKLNEHLRFHKELRFLDFLDLNGVNTKVKDITEALDIRSTSHFIQKYKERGKPTPGQHLKEFRDAVKAAMRRADLREKKALKNKKK